MKKQLYHVLAAAAVFGISFMPVTPASAGVNPRWGNYRLEISDNDPSAAAGPQLVRYYNSASRVPGMFGPGWITPYEVRLAVSPSGALTLYDICLGAEVRFNPAGAAGSHGKGEGTTARQSAAATERSLADIPVGSEFHSERCGCQTITRSADGFVRSEGGKEKEFFDREGRLVMMFQQEVVAINRDEAGRITQVSDTSGRTLNFTYNDRREVVQVGGWQGPQAEYRYDGKDDLVRSSAPGSGAQSYQYDDRHAMTLFRSGAQDAERISYFGPEQQFRVESVTPSGGETAHYRYLLEAGDPLSYGTTVQTGDPQQENPASISYRYREAVAGDGSKWLEKESIDYGDGSKETRYSEAGLPLTLAEDGVRTTFSYDARGRLVTKERSNGEVTELAYDPAYDKVARVRSFNRGDSSATLETTYRYDGQGNLVNAWDSTGVSASLTYDGANMVKTLDVGERRITFSYGTLNKPVLIQVAGLGEIKVSYHENGEIAETDAGDAGSSISLAVTESFATLLRLIRQAKVTLDGE